MENSTMVLVPKRAIHNYHTAKATVLQALANSNMQRDTHRLWKLLLHMDQMLLHFTPNPKITKEEQDKTTEQRVMERLELFWQGQWPMLINEATPEKRDAAPPWDDERLAKRAQDLTDVGEIGRAITLLTAPATFATDSSTIDDIRRLLHHLPDDGTHPPTATTQHIPRQERNMLQQPHGKNTTGIATE